MLKTFFRGKRSAFKESPLKIIIIKKDTILSYQSSSLKSLKSDYCELGMLKQERGEEKLLMLGQNGRPLRK